MKSRTWCFDKTLLKKDITRFAPVWIVFSALQLLSLGGVNIGYESRSYYAMSLSTAIGPMAIVNMIYAMIVAACLFGDLFRSRLCNSIHALPLRRETMLLTHVLAGVLFAVVPYGVLSLLYMLRVLKFWYVALLWLLGMVLEYLFFFALAVVCSVCTGSRFAVIAVYTVLNFFSKITQWLVVTFYEPLLPGLHVRSTLFDWFCPVVKCASMNGLVELLEKEGVSSFITVYDVLGLGGGWWYLAVLAVLGIAMLGLSIWLYRKRHLETAGDFLAFRQLLPVCSVMFTLTVSALFYTLGNEVGMVIGFAVGVFGTEMLLRRTVKVFHKKVWIKFGVLGGAFLLTLLVTWLDPLGLTRWTPEQVDTVVISNDYYYDSEYGQAQRSSSQELIREVTEIHELLLTEHTDLRDRYSQEETGAFHVTYVLPDGRQVERRYYYERDSEVGERIGKIYRAPEFVLGYEDWERYLASVESVMVDNWDGYWSFEGQEARELVEAIKADCQEGRIEPDSPYEETAHHVSVFTKTGCASINIPTRCPHTQAWIDKYLEQEPSK